MILDDKIGVDKEWFEGLTRSEQVLFVKSAKHVLTTAHANKLLKGVKSKKVEKKTKKVNNGL